MSKIKKSKSKSLQKKAQSQNSTKKIVLNFDIRIVMAKGIFKELLRIGALTLFTFAMSSCNNIGQQLATHETKQVSVNTTAINVEKVGVNIK